MSQSQKRLAYLISQYPSASHTFILREVLGLRKAGWHIDVASINADSRAPQSVTQDEVNEQKRTMVIKHMGVVTALLAHVSALLRHPASYLAALMFVLKLPTSSVKQSVWKLFYFTEAVMLGQWMTHKGQDHLHVHFGTAAASVAMMTRKIFPIRLSMTLHGPDELCDVKGQWLQQKLHTCDFVVCISHFARSQAMYHSDYPHWHKYHVCRLGVDKAWFDLGERREQAIADRLASQPFTLLCVGRLTPAKGQHHLVEAVASLVKRGISVRANLIGAGPDEAALREHIQAKGVEDHVHLLGLKNQLEVRELMLQSDVFALPSFAEGVPVALMEAMATGVPVLSTRIAGIGELINHRNTGCLIHAGDQAGLVEELAYLAQNPDACKALATNARAFVMAEYNLARNVPALGDLFDQLVTKEATCANSAPSCVAG